MATEIEELKQRIKTLEDQLQGTQYAVTQLAIALCAHGKFDISKVAKSLETLVEALKANPPIEQRPAFFTPAHGIIEFLKVSSEVVDKELSKSTANAR